MEICLLHANCQGGPLARFLATSPEFFARWRIVWCTNYTREDVPDDMIAHCSLFLYQHLSESWGHLASEKLLAKLPAHAVTLRVPNLFFKGYWPLWTSASRMNFGDMYLDTLVDKGLSAAEAVHVYLKANVAQLYDLDDLLAQSQAFQRQREAGCLVELVDYIEAHWQKEALFTTINHPGPKLVSMVGNAVLERLGLPGLAAHDCAGVDLSCDKHFHLPIHPGVAQYFSLDFAHENTRYPVFGRSMTFREYALCYADCRIRERPFLDYLQGAVDE